MARPAYPRARTYLEVKVKMKSKFWKAFLLLSIWMVPVPLGFATVDWEILNTLQLEAPPLDVAISPDGKTVYVLNNKGVILVYALDGNLTDKIEVGKQIDQIELGPKGERLFATSRQSKTVEVIALDFIQELSIKGSPYKGLKDAPVVIADFSDFE
jgi:hypothetical protein